MARRPGGASWESWIDTVINESRARGEFDDLPGAGKPLPDLDKPHDELWWVRKKLRDEGVSYLPPALALRKRKEETLELVARAPTEARVRALLSELNEEIRALNRRPAVGPPSNLSPVDVEAELATWRRARAETAESPSSLAEAPSVLPASRGRRRFRRPLFPRSRGDRS